MMREMKIGRGCSEVGEREGDSERPTETDCESESKQKKREATNRGGYMGGTTPGHIYP